MAALSADTDEEYEICNDDGFVYKRRRGLYPDVATPSAQAAGPNPEAARHRCRRHALLRLREKRLRELARWEVLEGKLLAQLPSPRSPPPQARPSSPGPVAATASASAFILDDLLARAEVEEAILKKVAGLCDEVDALCRAHEEDVVDAITALPVWGDPKELLISLQNPEAPGNLNFINDYQNEGNGGFQMSDSRQDRRAIEAGGYNRCQEAAGASPATVQSIKESGKTMKGGPYQCRTPAGLGDDSSILAEKWKKKRVANPSNSRSANKPKRFYQSISPNPISFSSGPTTRRAAAAAAAKMHSQEAPSY